MDEFPAPPQSFFLTAYDSTPPWEIGRPQATFLALADAGRISGRVLDAGCGTGALAVELAARGLDVTGVDLSSRAIELAQARAREHDVRVVFRTLSVFDLRQLGTEFDTVLDVGVFHGFDDVDRAKYIASLAAVTRTGGTLFLQCFSDRERSKIGPRRLSEADLRTAFASGWCVKSIVPVRYATLVHEDGADGWLMSAVKVQGG